MGIADRKELIRSSAPPSLLRYLKQERDDNELRFKDGILEWAESNGIRPLWERQIEFGRRIDTNLELASNVFLNPHARTALGSLLMAETPIDEAIEVVGSQNGLDVTPASITVFQDLFWDVSLVGRNGWARFLEELEEEQRSILALGVRGMRPNDIRYAMGTPRPSSPQEVLQDILDHAHNQFRQAMAAPNPAAHGAFKWAELATKVATSLPGGSKGRGGFGDEVEAQPISSNMFSVVVEEPRIVTLDDLEGEIAKNKTALDRAIEERAT